ncbi:MAG: hypothetical protein C0606_00750 [Hyphomicrobiales bacterium]|nr:MAG: hypothetical protein C0606_00750 [Hyphomicrobiales bacterium]
MRNDRPAKFAVFAENFRGMPNGWHNILACNFLVGENSTGKTSFMQLIEIIDSRQHQLLFEICGIVEGINTAFDVCSRHDVKNEVTVGFLTKEVGEEKAHGKDGVFGRLVTYKVIRGELAVKKVTIVSGRRIITLKREPKGVYFKLGSFFYDDGEAHAENGDRLLRAHIRKGRRFKIAKEVKWPDIASNVVWFAVFTSIATSSDEERGTAFMDLNPPLHCLQYAPLRAKTRRLYHSSKGDFSPTGEHVPYILRGVGGENSDLRDVVVKFGKESGLFDDIKVVSVKTSLKDKPFALQIKKGGGYFYVDELGFGVGQVLPIIADIAFSAKTYTLLIQQPELHLHPKAQASLGEVFLKATEEGGTFIVETHSDFIVDRFRLRLKQSKAVVAAQIIYFENDEKNGNLCHEILLDKEGELVGVPDGYRQFFLNESLDQFENM